MRMNWKTSRIKKGKYFNKEKLALGEKGNTSALMNIAQEDDSNIFKLLKNLWLNNLQFIIFKWSRFCLFIALVFILLLLYTQLFLIMYFSWLEKERKKQFKSQLSSWLLKFSLYSNPLYYSNSPINFRYFFQPPP